MKNRYFLIFLVIAFIQLCVPIYLIANREYILRTGTPFLFSTKPIDPYDAFRGRYVSLSFDFEDELDKKLKEKYSTYTKNSKEIISKTIFVSLANDDSGIARIAEISESKPDHNNYLRIRVTIPAYNDFLHYRLNFDRFYMDEFDAPAAENVYRKESNKKKAYALVYVKNGQTVLADLLIEKIPIRQYLKNDSTIKNLQ
jgi:uncharacterized membrane-anchored protein